MAVSVLLATAQPLTRDRVAHLLAEAEGLTLVQAVQDGPAILEALQRQPDVDVVIVDADLDNGAGHAVARHVGASFPLVGIAMLVESAGAQEYAEAMESGARSVIAVTSSLSEVVTRLESIAQWSASARAHLSADLTGGRGGLVVAVAGAKGGVGASVVSLVLARALAAGRSVAVVDLDLQDGDLAAYSGVHTRRSIVDLADVANEMSGRVLRETSYDLGGGLRLVSAPNEGEQGEDMTADQARAVVAALRYQFDVAVVDVGSYLTDVTATVLEYADRVLLVSTPDLPSLRGARRTLAMWERLAIRTPGGVHLVLNRQSSRSEVQEPLARRVAEIPVALTVPDGGSAFESAMNTATVLTASTAVHTAVGRKAASVVEQPAASASADRAVAGPVPASAAGPVAGDGDAAPDGQAAGGGRRRRGRRAVTAGAPGGGDRGQAAVELPVAIAVMALVLMLCVQGISYAASHVLAGNAAQEAARALSVGASVPQARAAARDELSGGWRDRSEVSVAGRSVTVAVRTPTVLPGVTLTARVSADAFEEPR